MHRTATALARLVRGAPIAVVTVALLLTAGLAAASTGLRTATGGEGFAPDDPHLDAAETLGERFHGSDEQVVQILVEGDDVVGAGAVAAVRAIETAVERSDAGPLLSSQPERPAVLSWLAPVEQALAEQGVDPATADDATIKAAFTDALATMPPQQAEMVTALLPDDIDVASGQRAGSGIVLVFHDTPPSAEGASDSEAFEHISGLHIDLAAAVGEAEVPAGFSAAAFSFPLLFADDGQFEAEIGTLFASAFAIILVILAFVYWLRPGLGMSVAGAGRRTVADVALTMTTIVMAIVWMHGVAALLGPGHLGVIGPLNDVTQIIPVLLIGLGVDYAIHITSRYREEVATGAPVDDAIGRAVTTVGVALVLATVTTAVGFLTNIVNPVPALQDFGVLAAVGIVASFVLMLTFVPALRLLLDRRAERLGHLPRQALGRTSERVLPGLMSRAAVLAERVPVATVLATVVHGGALGAWGMSRLETSFSVTDFVSDEAPAVATFDQIVERFGGGFGESTDVLISGDVATPQVHNALVASLGELAGVPDVAAFGDQAQAESPVSLLGALLAPESEAAPAPELLDAAAAAGVGGDLTVDGDADVAALYDALFAVAPERAEGVLARDGAGGYDHARVAIQTTAGEAGAGRLRANLDDVFTPVTAAGADVIPASDEIINDVVVTALSDSQISSMAITLAVAMLLLTVTFWFSHRRPFLGVITIAPVVLVVLWTFATMAATGIPFGPITATIAALAIGIGVPYTIHITNRYLEDRTARGDGAIRSTVRHTGGALAGSAFTTCAGFGVLITSSLTPFRQFGFVTVYAIGFALLAATLVLPSMLVLWDRWHRRRSPAAEVTDVETEPVAV